MRATPERLRDVSCIGAIQIDYLYLYLCSETTIMIATTTEPVNELDKRPVDRHVALYIHNTSTLACISQECGKVSSDRLKLASGEKMQQYTTETVYLFSVTFRAEQNTDCLYV